LRSSSASINDVIKATGSKAKAPSLKAKVNAKACQLNSKAKAVFPQGQAKAKATAGPGQ